MALTLVLLVLLAGSTVRGVADYAVRADDKLRIKIFQYPELSGEYTVSTTGTIKIAPIGEVSVEGASTDQIGNVISERFIRAGLSDKPGTSVEVLQSRPIYIMGDVQKPGEYPYRAGLTVLQAVSLAGGWMRFNDPGMLRLEHDSITIRGDMRNLVNKYYHLIAARARLKAEIALKTDVAFPPELMHQAKTDNGLAEALDEERSFLNIHVDALRNQLDSLDQTRALYLREIEAVSRQIESNKVQYESVSKELDQIKSLLARGLTTSNRKLDLERTLAQIDVAEQGFQTLILRARENITKVDQQMYDLKSHHQSTLSTELQTTRLQLHEISVKFDTNRDLLVNTQLTAPSLVIYSADDRAVGTRAITVVRMQNGKSVTMDAEDTMQLLPGDVLSVQRSVLPANLGAGPSRIPVHDITPARAAN